MGTPIRWEPYSKIVGIAFASLLLLGAGMAFWVRLLKVAVARKTRELEAKTVHLEESEERFRALFENTVQPIALTDEARLIAANEATLTMLRMERPSYGPASMQNGEPRIVRNMRAFWRRSSTMRRFTQISLHGSRRSRCDWIFRTSGLFMPADISLSWTG